MKKTICIVLIAITLFGCKKNTEMITKHQDVATVWKDTSLTAVHYLTQTVALLSATKAGRTITYSYATPGVKFIETQRTTDTTVWDYVAKYPGYADAVGTEIKTVVNGIYSVQVLNPFHQEVYYLSVNTSKVVQTSRLNCVQKAIKFCNEKDLACHVLFNINGGTYTGFAFGWGLACLFGWLH